ncbi:acyl carrier protein [Streptomyces noursei]|uniref:acyl carrier protein n=1 Tax=Streptomyces noursei TaxID=1971 RepID=UPI00081CAF51|nr:phosphopantetheine-containing protein [Streptomyces noursei ATCC 11455]
MTSDELEQMLTDVVHGNDASPDKRITLPPGAQDRTFDELEVDSLARAELVTVISDTYQIEIGDDQAAALTTPRQVLEFVASHTAGSSA